MFHYLEREARKARETRVTPSNAIIENVSRRQFIGAALTVSGFVLALRIAPASALAELPGLRATTRSPSSRIAPRWVLA